MKTVRIILSLLLSVSACQTPPVNDLEDSGADAERKDTIVAYGVGAERYDSEQLGTFSHTLHHISHNAIRSSSLQESYAMTLFLASLQGLLNAEQSDMLYIQNNNEYDWIPEMSRSVCDVRYWEDDLVGMIEHLLSGVASKGYILVDDFQKDDTGWMTDANHQVTAVAASYAAGYQALVLTPVLLENSLFDGLEMRFDARGKTMEDVLEFFISNPSLFAHDGIISSPRVPHRNVDLAIAHRWVAVHSFDDKLTDGFFSRIEPLSPRFSYNGPYDSEGKNVQFSSGYDLFALAAGWCGNLSTHERMIKTQKAVEHNQTRPEVDFDRQDVHYVLILCSDGGNLEYFDKKFRDCFTHPSYGTFPVSFMMTPAILEYKPAVHEWYYENMASDCSFVTSLSGLGDIYPVHMSGDDVREEYGRMTSAAMEKEGSRYLAIMDRAGEQNYSWEQLMEASEPIVRNIPQCEGVIFIGYAKIWSGETAVLNGVPVVPIRYSCFYSNGKPMDDPDNKKSQKAVSDALKLMPKDPTSTEGYSIILFNANPPDIDPKPQIMSDMQVLVDYIRQDEGIEIVDARQFFQLYNHHILHK